MNPDLLNIDDFAARVVAIAQDVTRPSEGMVAPRVSIRYLAKAQMGDALNLLLNIQETSIGAKDRETRLQDLATKCGLFFNPGTGRFS